MNFKTIGINIICSEFQNNKIFTDLSVNLDKYSAFVDEKINIAIKLNSTIDGVVKKYEAMK